MANVSEGDYINRLSTVAPNQLERGETSGAEDIGEYNTMRVDRVTTDTVRIFDLRTELQIEIDSNQFEKMLDEVLFMTVEE